MSTTIARASRTVGEHLEFSEPMTDSPPRWSWVFLVLLVTAALALRLAAWAHWGTGTIESEGAEYAKIAENLRNGVGYVGLVSSGPQVQFNPLYPWLIAAASFLTHNYELAGRLVSLIMGALLPLPVFGIASRLFNRRVGFIAAILTLFHPLLVYLSFMVYSEGPYLTLFLSGVYVVLRVLSHSSTRLWLLMGGIFGVAYLLRPEATLAFAVTLLFAVIAAEGDTGVKCKRAALAVLVFVFVALPQVIFLYRSTGKIMLEGKSRVLFVYSGRRTLFAENHPGMAYDGPGGSSTDVPSPAPDVEGGYPDRWQDKWAGNAIDSQLNGTGVAMRPYAETARQTSIRFQDMLRLIARGMRRNVPTLYPTLSSVWLGAPLLPALALLGAVRRPWRGPKARSRLYLLLIMGAPVVGTFFVLWADARYYFILVPLFSVWAANGLVELGSWLRATSLAERSKLLARPAVSQVMVPAFIALVMLVGTKGPVKSLYEFSDSALPYRVDKQIGLWIGSQQSTPIRIMDLMLPLSYHAGAQQHWWFPYCTGDLALRYLDKAKVDYVVLRRGGKFTKYYDEWVARGIPDARAELLQLPALPGTDKFIIYRWHWERIPVN